ncbi:hypothetical protein Asppvi_005660 [Aspergillus pseudoviridinutans]|uniref:DUF6594 domain-containing protein n=1 Tax=Aspergillus pseudoviridinutans TaxID=1517512 RepID=A0A9P3B9P5_9EURO|nr:uncharacterized protein Asppvi_005660 [Aspergillus pseudoviridinutans]GIJ86765.1 hypothetical protein Asppvi_005660 [Aspergillus pseudoviridinutans]
MSGLVGAVDRETAYEKAWKYLGYREYSRFLGSHANFLHVRLFRTLNARVLLAMQDYIIELEVELDKLDLEVAQPSAPDKHNGSFRQETSTKRMELVWELQKRLKAYNEYISTYSQLSKRRAVYHRDTTSVKNWLRGWPNAIHDEETGYLDHTSDLIYVTERDDSYVSRRPQRLFLTGRTWLARRPSGDDMRYIDSGTILLDEEKTAKLYTWAMLVLGLAMVMVPLWALAFVDGKVHKLIIITCFIFAFLVFTAFVTTARPFEALGATAAYAALLVVFLQVTP